ncbi:TetR/AcrR family transcriptional regulator [Nocardia nova]|uniref:TetR/AcrR family transcriptional regulator n=1 Tax=Nocardia nova TaxID=37330 RepID=UPI0033FCF206
MTARGANRGPAAARENRAALLAAAREVFAEYGADAPLRLIAQRAGVGKGSLYRHFPTRSAVIVAVFEDHVAALECFAARPDTTVEDVLGQVVNRLVDSVAFIAVLDPDDSSDPRLYEPGQRVIALLAAKLADPGLRAGLRPGLTVDEVFLAVSMLAALLHSTPSGERAQAARRGWELLLRALRDPAS